MARMLTLPLLIQQQLSDGVFKNFKKPLFPYLIGNKYNSRPNKFNFSRVSNQTDFDVNKSNAIRNTYPLVSQ